MASENSIGVRIRAARKSKGMTQRELGEHLGLDQTAVSKLETGTYEATPRQLNEFAIALGVSVGYLFGRDEQDEGLSADAVELALAYQKLPQDQQTALRKLVTTMLSRKY